MGDKAGAEVTGDTLEDRDEATTRIPHRLVALGGRYGLMFLHPVGFSVFLL